ncbi:MAG: hypothetical protein CVV52_18670, partial [Spirochaetae bacterium HGW-Spirochaetae-8]
MIKVLCLFFMSRAYTNRERGATIQFILVIMAIFRYTRPMETHDVTIIGAGVAGNAIARELSRTHLNVLVVE